ncbi:phytanoyl-CoA dioxygenase family protein [Daldinia childiae]|uniref:phytanoyl-CoA dioxygenase family protein n=1 Tax=Daldinia childiae TaxID=326645 RepID=UPI001444C036|nr:phytanoyl-CoA dioxygenase family protein [Daldinia childiae]KAF3055016.1 phytanoyl-CoA dioxygenase family protein [Daldinia childiae]
MPTSTLRSQLDKDGFVVLRSILSAEQVSQQRAAAERTRDLALKGSWPHVRTVGKQFPPWTWSPGVGIWGVQHLLNPALPDAPTFTASYFGDEVLDVAKELLGPCSDDELVMELYNLLVRPSDGTDYELRWHRDDIPAEASAREETVRLSEPAWHAQWNLALCDGDESLVVVPGSHARPRTELERAVGPFEPDMRGQLVVRLDAGDVVFYNNNILHRGRYDGSRERLSLHGSVGHVAGGKLRARNVLQHAVGSWVDKCDFSNLDEKQKERAEGMRARLVKLGSESGDVGYSLDG